ncbi:MAG: DUF533 domain-containing protein [Desulfuromusa sp.]|nr:DUF533 domain-containing protein [Desulfuromusa sp.]
MSLMGTLGKVAMGVMMAKGVGKMMGGSRSGSSSSSGLGGLLGGLMGGNSSAGSSAGLGGLLGSLTGKQGGAGLGGLLASLGGGSQSDSGSSGGLGDIFNQALQGKEVTASAEQEKEAEILLRAMINAAKSDGQLDEAEKGKITEHLDGISQEEAQFVQRELSAPLDVKGFINSVPRGMEEQVYLMSLFAINLDSKAEAQYLGQLAEGLNLTKQTCNQIHEKLGAPVIYS